MNEGEVNADAVANKERILMNFMVKVFWGSIRVRKRWNLEAVFNIL